MKCWNFIRNVYLTCVMKVLHRGLRFSYNFQMKSSLFQNLLTLFVCWDRKMSGKSFSIKDWSDFRDWSDRCRLFHQLKVVKMCCYEVPTESFSNIKAFNGKCFLIFTNARILLIKKKYRMTEFNRLRVLIQFVTIFLMSPISEVFHECCRHRFVHYLIDGQLTEIIFTWGHSIFFSTEKWTTEMISIRNITYLWTLHIKYRNLIEIFYFKDV